MINKKKRPIFYRLFQYMLKFWYLTLFAFITSIAGFIVGINSFKEENKFMMYTYIGTIANAVIWLGVLGMYLIYI